MNPGPIELAPELLTTPEAAEHWRVDHKTMGRWCATGKIPGAFQTPGGRWRIPAAAIHAPAAATTLTALIAQARQVADRIHIDYRPGTGEDDAPVTVLLDGGRDV